MQGYSKYTNELSHLIELQELLQQEVQLPLRIDINWENLLKTEFVLTLRGVEGLITEPTSTGTYKASVHIIHVTVPERYLELTRTREDAPKMTFQQLIFHPHVWGGGQICWGLNKLPAGDIFLVDWVLTLIEYIQYVSERIDVSSPAGDHGKDALTWWEANRYSIGRYLSLLDMERLRGVLVKRSKGIWGWGQ